MKQILILISSLLLFSYSKATHTDTIPIPPFSTTSVIDLSPTLESRILGGTQHYAVYLPPSYTKEPQRKYPVLYLLHGMYQNYRSWIHEEELQATADKAITEGVEEASSAQSQTQGFFGLMSILCAPFSSSFKFLGRLSV